jgi:hypothetical protein
MGFIFEGIYINWNFEGIYINWNMGRTAKRDLEVLCSSVKSFRQEYAQALHQGLISVSSR